MLINNKVAILCQQTQQYYFGSRDSIPSRLLQGAKCIALAYPDIRSQFDYKKDYKLVVPNILYSIIHEINDYKVLTIPLETISGNNNKMSRIVIASRAKIKAYTASFTSLGLCVHAMCDIWQLMLLATCKLLPQVKSAWVIAASEQAIYLFYFKNNSIYLHMSFEPDALQEVVAVVDGFKKDFLDIGANAWCVGPLSPELALGLTSKGLILQDMPTKSDAMSKLSFEKLCCIGAIAYMELVKAIN
jgi:hypothetical protein